jgi:hypothetical protein
VYDASVCSAGSLIEDSPDRTRQYQYRYVPGTGTDSDEELMSNFVTASGQMPDEGFSEMMSTHNGRDSVNDDVKLLIVFWFCFQPLSEIR